jgi:hypothetical protein
LISEGIKKGELRLSLFLLSILAGSEQLLLKDRAKVRFPKWWVKLGAGLIGSFLLKGNEVRMDIGGAQ